jgi:hypothetical protein
MIRNFLWLTASYICIVHSMGTQQCKAQSIKNTPLHHSIGLYIKPNETIELGRINFLMSYSAFKPIAVNPSDQNKYLALGLRTALEQTLIQPVQSDGINIPKVKKNGRIANTNKSPMFSICPHLLYQGKNSKRKRTRALQLGFGLGLMPVTYCEFELGDSADYCLEYVTTSSLVRFTNIELHKGWEINENYKVSAVYGATLSYYYQSSIFERYSYGDLKSTTVNNKWNAAAPSVYLGVQFQIR